MIAVTQLSVLIIDDDRDILAGMVEAIEETGRTARGATSAEDGLALLNAGAPPCLVLLDLRMPGIGGVAFLKQCRSQLARRSLPVVLMTTVRDRQRAEAEPLADGVLIKPFELAELEVFLQRYCPVEGVAPS